MDWTGNIISTYSTIGASNHSVSNRADKDFYATEPRATELLLKNEDFTPRIWEPACGEGHISRVLTNNGYDVLSTDIVYRGYGDIDTIDFLACDIEECMMDIITNPPYKFALEFIQKAIEIMRTDGKIAMFLKLQFLEGKKRKPFFLNNPPRTVYVSSSRLCCAKNGNFVKGMPRAVAYAWYVWEKGFDGSPEIKWIN